MPNAQRYHDCHIDTLRRRLAQSGHQCFWCGALRGRDFHHIQPRAAGGSDDPSNLIWICDCCHAVLDEFCKKHWNDPAQAARMELIRGKSVNAVFEDWVKDGKDWKIGNGGIRLVCNGPAPKQQRTADDIWRDMLQLRKH